jgi:hypothetical protein
MTKTNIDYSKTIIYKIVCNNLNIKDIYVGHTTDFTKRKHCHKSRCNNENGKYYTYIVYDTIRKNGGWDNWSMIEVEKFACNDGNEARKRERYWMEKTMANLNSICSFQTAEELKLQNKEYHKIYREENKEHIKEMDKLYRINNIETIKANKKQYAVHNREKINAHKRIYDAIKFICECGSIIRRDCKSDHFKTKKHLKFCAESK